MAEQRRPVQPVRVSYACDKCGGDVQADGTCLTSNPAKYPHSCSQCGERYMFTIMYPAIAYIDAVDVANDLARKTLDLPTDCDALAPTFDERHAANVAALAEIHDMVWGDTK